MEQNGEKLTELLQIITDELEPDCLRRALIAAIKNDNHQNVGKIIVKGANPTVKENVIREALRQAENGSKPYARAMLLLVHAAMTNDVNLVLQLFTEPGSESNSEQVLLYAERRAVASGEISTAIPIEIARKHNKAAVREELLMKTDVNPRRKCVSWHGLKLLSLEVSWLRRIEWAEKLIMVQNGLKTLPAEIGIHLKQVSDSFG